MAKGPMTAFGPITQLAYVPKDFKGALRYWTETMGVGPFFILPHVERMIKGSAYMGRPADVHYSLAIGYWGDIQIELIEQHNDTPSIYSNWLREGREGVHHVCVIVDDIEAAREAGLAAGGKIVQEVFLESGGAIYVDAGGGPGTLLELIQFPPGQAELFAMMREAARGWDGTDPVRTIG